MIQFNLLPDIKIEYIKAERNKRLIISVAVLASLVSVGTLVVLSTFVFVFQKQHMNDLTNDITTYTRDLSGTGDLSKILTVQNQLNALTDLHSKKQAATKIFPYIQQFTPTDVSISAFDIDFEGSVITVSGVSKAPSTANQLASVNKFVDTLKFTDYQLQGADKRRAFSEVVLTSFGRSQSEASFSINFKFDPIIFSNTESATLVVPTQITSRSETEKPNALFEATPSGGNQ